MSKKKIIKELRIVADDGTILTQKELNEIMESFCLRNWAVELKRDESKWILKATKIIK